MAKVSYAKLWKKLEENGMKKRDLVAATKISTNALAKLGKNEDVRVNISVRNIYRDNLKGWDTTHKIVCKIEEVI